MALIQTMWARLRGDCGGLAQEKTSDPLLDSTLFCSMEELQGESESVCGWGVAYLLFALLLECNKKFSAQPENIDGRV